VHDVCAESDSAFFLGPLSSTATCITQKLQPRDHKVAGQQGLLANFFTLAIDVKNGKTFILRTIYIIYVYVCVCGYGYHHTKTSQHHNIIIVIIIIITQPHPLYHKASQNKYNHHVSPNDITKTKT